MSALAFSNGKPYVDGNGGLDFFNGGLVVAGEGGSTLIPVGKLHEAPFVHATAILLSTPIANPITRLLAAPMSAAIAALHAAPMAMTLPVVQLHAAPIEVPEHEPIEGAFVLHAGYGIEGAFTLKYDLGGVIEGAFVLDSGLAPEIQGAFTLGHELGGNEIEGAFTLLYSLQDETPIITTGTVTLTKDGELIPLADDVEISLEEGDHYWKAAVTLKSPGDSGQFKFADAVTLSYYGVDFALVVDKVKIDRPKPASHSATLKLVSPSALLGKPPAKPLTNTWGTPESAKAIVEALIGPVEWRIIDWAIPANRLGAENAYPMEVAKRIVAAAGGVIEPYPNGSLYARYLFETPLNQYPVATPAHELTEDDDIFSLADSNEYLDLADQLRITDIEDAGFADRIEFVADDDNGLAGAVHVYPSPWRDVVLTHTGPGGIALTAQGEQLLEKEAQIEILDGKGTLPYPIAAIVAVEWHEPDLGGLGFVPGSNTVISTLGGESLCTVTYQTRAKVWRTSSPIENTVQFVLYDG